MKKLFDRFFNWLDKKDPGERFVDEWVVGSDWINEVFQSEDEAFLYCKEQLSKVEFKPKFCTVIGGPCRKDCVALVKPRVSGNNKFWLHYICTHRDFGGYLIVSGYDEMIEIKHRAYWEKICQ